MAHITISKIAASPCVECRHVGSHVSLVDKPRPPAPGDKTLCCGCGSLNILDEHLIFRAPNVDEFLDVAGDAEAQMMRRAILSLKTKAEKETRA